MKPSQIFEEIKANVNDLNKKIESMIIKEISILFDNAYKGKINLYIRKEVD